MKKGVSKVFKLAGIILSILCIIGMFTSGFVIGIALLLFLGVFPFTIGVYLDKGQAFKTKFFLISAVSLIIGSILFSTLPSDPLTIKKETKQEVSGIKPDEDLSYQIINTDSTSYYIKYSIVIPERYNEKDLIEIMRRIRTDRDWENKLMAYFYIKHYTENNTYYGLGYLPNGGPQANKDSDGKYISVTKIGMSQPEFKIVEAVNFDSLPGSKVIASMVDELGKSKNQIILTPNNEYLYVHLFGKGDKLVEKLLAPKSGTITYFFDLPKDDMDYGYHIKLIPNDNIAIAYGKNENKVQTYVLMD